MSHLDQYREAAKKVAAQRVQDDLRKKREAIRDKAQRDWRISLLSFTLGLVFSMFITWGPSLQYHWQPAHVAPPAEVPLIVVSHGRWREAYYLRESRSYHSTEDGTKVNDVLWWMVLPEVPRPNGEVR